MSSYSSKAPVADSASFHPKLQQLIAQGELDKPGQDGMRALHWACCLDDARACRYLLRIGADPEVRNRSGSTALLAASDRNAVKCVELLLRSGVQVNTQNKRGDTALHLAAFRGYLDVLKLLSDSCANPWLTNKAKLSALQEAQCQGHIACSDYLAHYEKEYSQLRCSITLADDKMRKVPHILTPPAKEEPGLKHKQSSACMKDATSSSANLENARELTFATSIPDLPHDLTNSSIPSMASCDSSQAAPNGAAQISSIQHCIKTPQSFDSGVSSAFGSRYCLSSNQGCVESTCSQNSTKSSQFCRTVTQGPPGSCKAHQVPTHCTGAIIAQDCTTRTFDTTHTFDKTRTWQEAKEPQEYLHQSKDTGKQTVQMERLEDSYLGGKVMATPDPTRSVFQLQNKVDVLGKRLRMAEAKLETVMECLEGMKITNNNLQQSVTFLAQALKDLQHKSPTDNGHDNSDLSRDLRRPLSAIYAAYPDESIGNTSSILSFTTNNHSCRPEVLYSRGCQEF